VELVAAEQQIAPEREKIISSGLSSLQVYWALLFIPECRQMRVITINDGIKI
jgi:hypothetical protein